MKKSHLRLCAIALILFFLENLHFLLFGRVMTDFLSLISMGDRISYNKTCVLIGAIPLVMYVVVAMVRVLFSKDVKYQALPDPYEKWVLLTITFSFLLGLIADCIIPFLFMALSYHSCPQDTLRDYHVTDIALCKTLVDNRSFW
ncbi:hypothetical protein J5Y28_000868 [Citrobacter sedlakii]|nr:hypothetical protein [Citrobacter sedlakii]